MPHSMMIMFRAFNGERIQPERECWLAAAPLCVLVFYPITIFGNLMVSNSLAVELLFN